MALAIGGDCRPPPIARGSTKGKSGNEKGAPGHPRSAFVSLRLNLRLVAAPTAAAIVVRVPAQLVPNPLDLYVDRSGIPLIDAVAAGTVNDPLGAANVVLQIDGFGTGQPAGTAKLVHLIAHLLDFILPASGHVLIITITGPRPLGIGRSGETEDRSGGGQGKKHFTHHGSP